MESLRTGAPGKAAAVKRRASPAKGGADCAKENRVRKNQPACAGAAEARAGTKRVGRAV